MVLANSGKQQLLDGEAVHNGHMSKVERYKWADPTKPGALSFVDKSLLSVDHKYQRDGTEAKILEIASKFNWPAFGVLTVARRGDKLFVVDGQHRWLGAMKRADVRKVPCIIFDSGGIEGEARTFIDAQTLRKPVTAVAKFKALLICKDPTAIALNVLIEDSGRKVARFSSGSTINCIAVLTRLYTVDPQTLGKVWTVLIRVCRGVPIHDRLVQAMFYVERHLPEGSTLTDKRWSDRMMNIGPERLVKQIQSASAYYQSGGARVWADGLLSIINKGLKAESHLKLSKKLEND